MKVIENQKHSRILSPLVFALSLLLFSVNTHKLKALDLDGRPGLGLSNQFIHGIPGLSLKIQHGPSMAFGVLAGFNTSNPSSKYGLGLKFYKIIFDEPQLNFYSSLLMATISSRQGENADADKGYQLELALGSEFSFVNLNSIGFSFEFGLGIHKLGEETVLYVAGAHIVRAGIHFYL